MATLNIGITVYLQESSREDDIIWRNGNRQTSFYLYKLISNTKHNAFLVGDLHKDKQSNTYFKGIKIHSLNELKDDLDILIIFGISVGDRDAKYLTSVGCKIIGFQSGNDYIFQAEDILFKPSVITNHSIDSSFLFEEIWTIPQHFNTCYHFTKTLLRKPVVCFPHIWHPFFLDIAKKDIEKHGKIKVNYTNSGKKEKRISIFEPNINVVKTALIPILVVEKMYAKKPDLLDRLSVTNTGGIKDKLQFSEFISQLDLTKDKKIYFDARHPIVTWLSEQTDVCVIHQWENAMNNMYLDALYLNYPLIHNSHFWKDYGYYYNDFNIEEGSEALIEAIEHHDANLDSYREKSSELIWAHHADNPKNIGFFEGLVQRFENKKH